MRLVDADSLLEKWNKLSEKDRIKFDKIIKLEASVYDFITRYNEDNRPECCKVHDKYFSTCDTCEYGESEEENDEEEEDAAAIDFYTGIANREWYDFDNIWKKSLALKRIVVCAENKEIAKEKLIFSINSLNKEMNIAGERYMLDEESIKKVHGFISAVNVILD